ncbi:hypothetical protein FA95DRAFT_1578643 [Auriscalpium vulgare]|uniref:Uncharacterized protein n=1 Tax=Auriscalpium vulgare TaxID=40419 RepID=A0ACB8R1E0_9AGAM|nr:hypothetical protein FA95DRAFT_1578643 [Auriscalpium vulgare]
MSVDLNDHLVDTSTTWQGRVQTLSRLDGGEYGLHVTRFGRRVVNWHNNRLRIEDPLTSQLQPSAMNVWYHGILCRFACDDEFGRPSAEASVTVRPIDDVTLASAEKMLYEAVRQGPYAQAIFGTNQRGTITASRQLATAETRGQNFTWYGLNDRSSSLCSATQIRADSSMTARNIFRDLLLNCCGRHLAPPRLESHHVLERVLNVVRLRATPAAQRASPYGRGRLLKLRQVDRRCGSQTTNRSPCLAMASNVIDGDLLASLQTAELYWVTSRLRFALRAIPEGDVALKEFGFGLAAESAICVGRMGEYALSAEIIHAPAPELIQLRRISSSAAKAIRHLDDIRQLVPYGPDLPLSDCFPAPPLNPWWVDGFICHDMPDRGLLLALERYTSWQYIEDYTEQGNPAMQLLQQEIGESMAAAREDLRLAMNADMQLIKEQYNEFAKEAMKMHCALMAIYFTIPLNRFLFAPKSDENAL